MSDDLPKPPDSEPNGVAAPVEGRARMNFHTDVSLPAQPVVKRLLDGLVPYDQKVEDNRDALVAPVRLNSTLLMSVAPPVAAPPTSEEQAQGDAMAAEAVPAAPASDSSLALPPNPITPFPARGYKRIETGNSGGAAATPGQALHLKATMQSTPVAAGLNGAAVVRQRGTIPLLVSEGPDTQQTPAVLPGTRGEARGLASVSEFEHAVDTLSERVTPQGTTQNQVGDPDAATDAGPISARSAAMRASHSASTSPGVGPHVRLVSIGGGAGAAENSNRTKPYRTKTSAEEPPDAKAPAEPPARLMTQSSLAGMGPIPLVTDAGWVQYTTGVVYDKPRAGVMGQHTKSTAPPSSAQGGDVARVAAGFARLPPPKSGYDASGHRDLHEVLNNSKGPVDPLDAAMLRAELLANSNDPRSAAAARLLRLAREQHKSLEPKRSLPPEPEGFISRLITRTVVSGLNAPRLTKQSMVLPVLVGLVLAVVVGGLVIYFSTGRIATDAAAPEPTGTGAAQGTAAQSGTAAAAPSVAVSAAPVVAAAVAVPTEASLALPPTASAIPSTAASAAESTAGPARSSAPRPAVRPVATGSAKPLPTGMIPE
jgi:hypothetical protein